MIISRLGFTDAIKTLLVRNTMNGGLELSLFWAVGGSEL